MLAYQVRTSHEVAFNRCFKDPCGFKEAPQAPSRLGTQGRAMWWASDPALLQTAAQLLPRLHVTFHVYKCFAASQVFETMGLDNLKGSVSLTWLYTGISPRISENADAWDIAQKCLLGHGYGLNMPMHRCLHLELVLTWSAKARSRSPTSLPSIYSTQSSHEA